MELIYSMLHFNPRSSCPMYENATFRKIFNKYSIEYDEFSDMPENTTSDKIKKLRAIHKLSQKELAKRIGRSEATITQWEIGRCNPNSTAQHTMIKLFNLNNNYFNQN